MRRNGLDHTYYVIIIDQDLEDVLKRYHAFVSEKKGRKIVTV